MPTEQLLCIRCLVGLPYTRMRNYRENQSAEPFYHILPIEHAYSHYFYNKEDPSHRLITLLKYSHRPYIGHWLGRTIGAEIKRNGFFDMPMGVPPIDAIVPVPLHWWRQLWRGYNQSHIIARGLREATNLPIDNNIVRRTQLTKRQVMTTDAIERISNVRGIFEAQPTERRHLLIVDDVMTTGATIVECAEAIVRANPRIHISVFTPCRTTRL